MKLYNTLILICMALLTGCVVKLVELDREALVRKPITAIEILVKDNRVHAQNNTRAGLIGSFFGYPGLLIGTLAEHEINRSRQKGIEPLNNTLQGYDLAERFAEKMERIGLAPAFDQNVEIKVSDVGDSSDIYPKLELRFTLSKDLKTLAVNALMVHRENAKLKEKYQKVYLSMSNLNILTSDTEQDVDVLLQNPEILKEAIEASMSDIIDLFEEDFRQDTFRQALKSATEVAAVPAIYGTAYGSNYRGMKIVRDIDNKTILVSRDTGNLIVKVPSSWLKNREKNR